MCFTYSTFVSCNPPTPIPPRLCSCFWLRCLWTGTRWRFNAVEWAWLRRTYCRCSSRLNKSLYRYVYSVVYQSGCDNLIFNSENDGCYLIIMAQRSCRLLCCGSCALPSVLLIKFLPKYYSVLLDYLQYEAENKHDWQINCVPSQNRSGLRRSMSRSVISNWEREVWWGGGGGFWCFHCTASTPLCFKNNQLKKLTYI